MTVDKQTDTVGSSTPQTPSSVVAAPSALTPVAPRAGGLLQVSNTIIEAWTGGSNLKKRAKRFPLDVHCCHPADFRSATQTKQTCSQGFTRSDWKLHSTEEEGGTHLDDWFELL